jgi:spore maturation protein SpmA
LDKVVRNCLAHMLPDTFGQLCPQLSGAHAAGHILTNMSGNVWLAGLGNFG